MFGRRVRAPIGVLVLVLTLFVPSGSAQGVHYWDNPASWPELGHVPTASDDAVIPAGRIIVLRGVGEVRSIRVDGTLLIQQGVVAALNLRGGNAVGSRGNLLLTGTLDSEDGQSLTNPFTITFYNIQESRFVGGGDMPLDTDTGLWVTGAGQLKVKGAAKLAWARATNSLSAGATSLTLDADPTGWRVGDEILIAPTGPTSEASPAYYDRFEVKTVTSIVSRTVSFSALTYAHPAVTIEGTVYAAEVANLTRMVTIQGQPGARAHGLFMTMVPQTLQYITFRYMGPRLTTAGVPGRYPLHFHHMMDAARGSLWQGLVVRDSGFRAFVPHASYGVTGRDLVAYNVTDEAYWFDDRDPQGIPISTNDLTWNHDFAARVLGTNPGGRNTAFWIGRGTGNTIINSVAVGVQGSSSSGFHWPEGNATGTWVFGGAGQENVGHNNQIGCIFVWQNHDAVHLIGRSTCYRNRFGINHGAYTNRYDYNGLRLFENSPNGSVINLAVSSPSTLIFENLVLDLNSTGAYNFKVGSHNTASTLSTVVRNNTFRGATAADVLIDDGNTTIPSYVDFCYNTFVDNAFWFNSNAVASSVIRVQPDPRTRTGAVALHRYDWPSGTFYAPWNAKVISIPLFCP